MAAESPKDPTPRKLLPPYPDHPYFTDGDGRPLRVDGGAHAFKPDARGLELVNAWWLAEASTLVYFGLDVVGQKFRAAGLTEVKSFDRGGTQCYVASNERLAVVAFRGTEAGALSLHDIGEIITDVQVDGHFLPVPFGLGGRVHEGFARAALAVWEDGDEGFKGLGSYLSGLMRDGSRALWFTGYSLGGAAATLAAVACIRSGLPVSGLYTIGSPRVGDAEFGAAFAELFPGGPGPEYQRFVNDRDIVPRVPPGPVYEHVGTLNQIDERGSITTWGEPGDDAPEELAAARREVVSLLELAADLAQKFELPVLAPGLPRLPGALGKFADRKLEDLHRRFDAELLKHVPLAFKDHVPTMYAAHIWNAYIKSLE